MPYTIDQQLCAACGSCIGNCPNRAIMRTGGAVHVTGMCWDCGICRRYCTTGAIGPGPRRAERDVRKLAAGLKERLDLKKNIAAMKLADQAPAEIAIEQGPHFWCGICGDVFDGQEHPVFFTAQASSCGGCANIGCGARTATREEFDTVLEAQVVGEGKLYACREAMSNNRMLFPRFPTLYKGMIIGPLERMPNPDLILFPANAHQLCVISTAFAFETGEIIAGFAGKSTCLMTVANPLVVNKPVFCAGDHGGRMFMRLQDVELLVCFPFSLVPGLVATMARTIYAAA